MGGNSNNCNKCNLYDVKDFYSGALAVSVVAFNWRSNSLNLLYTLANSIIVGHDFSKYCMEPSTLPKALIICCITPKVTTPATMAGAKNT